MNLLQINERKEGEIKRLEALDNESKSRMDVDKVVISHLTTSNLTFAQTFSSLEVRNEALLKRLSTVEESLPIGDTRTRLRSSRAGPNPFSQMRKGEFLTYVSNLDERFHAICLTVRDCAQSIRFYEVTESELKSVNGALDETRVRNWRGKFHSLSLVPSEVAHGSPPLIIDLSRVANAVPMSPFDLIHHNFFTPSGPSTGSMIEAAVYNYFNNFPAFSRFKSEEAYSEVLSAFTNHAATISYFQRK